MGAPDISLAWPVEIRLPKDRRTLRVAFDDGRTFDLPAELLRVTSPSAEVQGHSEAERKTVGGKRNVTILSVDPVGNYAVRIGFDDMVRARTAHDDQARYIRPRVARADRRAVKFRSMRRLYRDRFAPARYRPAQ